MGAKLRVKDILTEDELLEVHHLNKKIMGATRKTQIYDNRKKIKQIIEEAKSRYFNEKRD